MGVREIDRFLERWQMDARDLHRRLILAPSPGSWNDGTPSGCWPKAGRPRPLRRLWDPHTIGRWAAAFGGGGPRALIFEQSRGSPRPRRGTTGTLREAVRELPAAAGIGLVNWN